MTLVCTAEFHNSHKYLEGGSQSQGLLRAFLLIENENSSDDEMIVKTTAATSIMINGLQAFTNYSIHVAAMTRIGEGVRSASINCVTEEDGMCT